MATYNKRGYKPEKPKVEKEENAHQAVLNDKSDTAEVFNSLDSTANKIGTWFTLNQSKVFYAIGALAIATVGYFVYDNFIMEPKQDEAANDMFQAQQYYEQAVNGQATDSLYNLALNGGEGKMGFLGIINEYSGTDAANLAHYYAGTSYLNMGKFKEAIEHLEQFNSKDLFLKAMSLGAIGDAFAELNQPQEAFEFYKKASEHTPNDFSTPRYAYKAGLMAIELGKKEEALKLFTNVKDNYKGSVEAANIDVYLGMAQ
ncbi:Tetratricopeptide repeat-containing protein [Paenimyroides aquimaris]|uniref:Tetratricopeptide repeat-containing protein n=1 Tax=Paenimyroides marinum TaxID=1159016 RepID=A0A1H6KFG0_9FLAO|nr:tetratricopeptide repeat protein [Paenimyroides aquimaris]SEH70551.1 Tetratricopeptide repeat-containing protein [Paenimyroides aquimaris]